MKHIYLLLVSTMIVGCSSQPLVVENVKIENETRLGELHATQRKEIISLNKSDAGGIFSSAQAVTVNGYRILFSPGHDEIIIAKNKVPLVGVSGEGRDIAVYKNLPEAPSAGSEKILAGTNYLFYRGDTYFVEDYGYDGPDVMGEIFNPQRAQSFIAGQTCKTLTAGVACCEDKNHRFLTGYRFTPQTGWQAFSSETLLKNCEKLEKQSIR